jgi:mono/diheme cytochrome c family protein
VFLLAACTVLAVGCGESEPGLSKDEYIEQVRALGADLEPTLAELDDAEFSNTKELAQAIDRIGSQLEELGTRADELNPPAEVADTHADLAAAITEFGAWFHEVAERIRATPQGELEALLEREYGIPLGFGDFDPSKVDAAKNLERAVNELNDKGYSFEEASNGQYASDGPGDADAGKEIFSSAGCGGCHTLADAGATGALGPSLDASRPPYGLVIERVTNGQGIMPRFATTLNGEQIQDVAAYVSQAARR